MYMRDRGTEVARPGSVPVLAEQDGVGRRSLGRGADQSPSVHAAYLGGQTVVIEAAEMWFASINRVSRALMAYFDYDFTASLHLTPRNHVAMAAQSSSADLFVLQVRGSSTWEMNGARSCSSLSLSRARARRFVLRRGLACRLTPCVCADAVPEASGEARQPYSQHTLAAGDANAIAALDPTNADSKGTLFSASLTRGDFLFVPRGWIHSARSLEQSHSGMLIFTVESERFSVGRFLQVLLGTLAKSLEDEQKSGSAKDSIFTHTQATALVDGLVAQFVTNSINETDQDWIRAPLPLGSRAEGKGLRSLVGFTRTKLETLRDRMKATSPVCDKGTQGCAGSINTLTGNMAMLQGLVKFVYESAFGGPLTDRVTSLSSQGSQQRLWKEQAQRLLCAADAGQETANGVHDTQGLGLSAELRVVTAELDGKCKGGIGAESGGAAVEEEQALAELLEKSVNAGGAAGLVLVAELPSATDDDMERVSVAAMLLDRGCAVLTAEQAAYTTEACGDTGPSKDEL